MADFDLDAFTKCVQEAYEQRVATLLPHAKLGNLPNPDEQLLGLGLKFSSPVSFEDASIRMEWTPTFPEPDAFAEALAEAARSKVESSTVADKEFVPAPQVFVFHKGLPRNALPSQAKQSLAASDKTCVLGQVWFDKVNVVEFRTRFAVCQIKGPEKEPFPV